MEPRHRPFPSRTVRGGRFARIRGDHSIDDAVRRLALALVQPQSQNIRRQAAFVHVWTAIGTGQPKQDILNEVRNNKKITDQLRRETLRFVEQYPENIAYIHWCSRMAVGRDQLASAQYSLALRQAEAACHADPDNATYVTTLGMALYRQGRFAEALGTLSPCFSPGHIDDRPRESGVPGDGPFSSRAEAGIPESAA